MVTEDVWSRGLEKVGVMRLLSVARHGEVIAVGLSVVISER